MKYPMPLTEKYIMTQKKGRRKKLRVILKAQCKCAKCGQVKPLDVDHIIPKADGGTYAYENLQALCRTCHLNKTRKENKGRHIMSNVTQDCEVVNG